MAKIFFLGYPPSVLLKNKKQEAANFRAWQFMDPLIAAGHQVFLCAAEPETQIVIPPEWQSGLVYRQICYNQRGWIRQLQQVHNQTQPDCIVAANYSHCLYATRLATERPIWMDFYGDPLTIMQAAAYRARSNRGIVTSVLFALQALQKGDVFSVCGTTQKHLLMGELVMTGRLNAETFGYDFTRVILPGVPPLSNKKRGDHRPLLSPLGITERDFVVLWCGGYNTWTDVKTLFSGLECAMAQDARIHFVSIGASTYQAADNVYEQFQRLVQGSIFNQHYHFLGWLPWNQIPPYYAESDCGINIDAVHAETTYGTRTRITEMMAAGLVPVTSLGSELSYILRDNGLGFTFAPGDADAFGHCLIQLSQSPKRLKALSETGLDYAANVLSFSKTVSPLSDWLQNPSKAPDHLNQNQRSKVKQIEFLGRAFLRQMIWRMFGYDS